MSTTFFRMLAACLCVFAVANAESVPEKSWAVLPPHPRLFADAAHWEALKQQVASDEVSRQIFAVVRNSAERVLAQPPVAYVDTGAFWHGPMRQAQGRILALAMTYRLTGEVRFLARAKVEMQTMADLPNWYPQHFLDTAEGALGMAVGLDWLHDVLTPEERGHFERALRVSADGSRTEILANGFRAANGVCLNPDGTFFVTDQEGHWTPKNKINRVVPDGGFYGNMFGYSAVTDTSESASAFRQVVKQAGLKRLQRALLLAEEVGLRLALSFTLQRVAVERVVGNLLLPGFQQLGGELVGVDAGECVIHEVLQMIGIAALSRGAEQDHGFQDEDAALRLLRRHGLVHEHIADRLRPLHRGRADFAGLCPFRPDRALARRRDQSARGTP